LLRRRLAQPESYPTIAVAVASGGLPQFPVALFDHVGDVHRRVETATGGDFEHVEALRLTTLVHEEPLESLPQLLGSAGVSELLPEVEAVTREIRSRLEGQDGRRSPRPCREEQAVSCRDPPLRARARRAVDP
jgi:hypothetical protein